MDPSQITLIIVLVVLILFSSFFSAAETAYSCVNKVRLKSMEAAGDKKAAKVLRLIDNYDKLLSTILIGNNIVNITSASIATVLFISFFSTAHSDLATTLSTVVMTVLVLIFGEITPKSIAKERPESFAFFARPILAFLMIILTPINALFVLWKKLLTKIFKFKKEASITEDELITMVETAHDEGGLDEHESQLIRSAIEFEDLDVDDIMVPRVNVIALEKNSSMDEIAGIFKEHGFSRLPVYDGTIDSVIGIIHEKDFYFTLREGGENISSIIQSCICVSGSMKISAVLRMIQKAKVHMAIVVDEFGGTAGIITLEDILEELVGEIYDEHDEVEVLYKKVDDNTFLVSGSENLEDMFEELDVDAKEEFDSTSVGGWATEQLGKIPRAGERFSFLNLDVTVTKANAKRVLEVRIKVNEKPDEEQSKIGKIFGKAL